jgi:uncharacterized protein YutE (UPF0331/DUF86 family)
MRKVTSLREHLSRAVRRRSDEFSTLRDDIDRQDALSMSVLASIQDAVDIAFHLASAQGWSIPASYAESFEILAKHGVISADLVEPLISATALRNRIAHGYGSVDIERLWRELPSGLAALEGYAVAIATYVSVPKSGAPEK